MAKKTNAPAPAPKDVATKAPETPVKAPKAETPKDKKIEYPMEEGKKLDKAPKDWDPETHRPLRRAMFSCPSIWMDWKADQLQLQVDSYRTEAKAIRDLGGAAAARDAKTILTLVAKAEELKAKLGENVDVEALLAALGK